MNKHRRNQRDFNCLDGPYSLCGWLINSYECLLSSLSSISDFELGTSDLVNLMVIVQ